MLGVTGGGLRSLLGPLEVHARLHGEGCQHLLLLGRQRGHGAGGRRGGRHDEGAAQLLSRGVADEELIVNNAQPN